MYKCSICSSDMKSEYRCEICGYDRRKDFIKWRTLCLVPEVNEKEYLDYKSKTFSHEQNVHEGCKRHKRKLEFMIDTSKNNLNLDIMSINCNYANTSGTHKNKIWKKRFLRVVICAVFLLLLYRRWYTYTEWWYTKNVGDIKDLNNERDNLLPTYYWDFSSSMYEQNGLSNELFGDVNLQEYEGIQTASFDGDGDYIYCGTEMNLSEKYTFSIVFCCQDVYKDYSAFFAKYESNYEGAYSYSINQGHINCWITEESGNYLELESLTKIENNKWYCVTIVKEGLKFQLYVNGKKEAEGEVDSIIYNDDAVTIGRQALMFYPEDQLQFEGYIKEISIFEQVLSEEEIIKLSNQLFGKIDMSNRETRSIPADALFWNGHYYAFYNNCKSWDEAKRYCESKGGHLATITSEEENLKVFSYIKDEGAESAYFGYSDDINENSWYWVTEETADYTNWHEDEPNAENTNEDYAMYYYKYDDGTWNDGDFGGQTVNGGTGFICEWE